MHNFGYQPAIIALQKNAYSIPEKIFSSPDINASNSQKVTLNIYFFFGRH